MLTTKATFRLTPEDIANLDNVADAVRSTQARPFVTQTDAFRAALRIAAGTLTNPAGHPQTPPQIA